MSETDSPSPPPPSGPSPEESPSSPDALSPTLPGQHQPRLEGLDPRELIEAGLRSSPPASWQPPSPEELSQLLPQYEIDAFLGRGGMGAVYRGRQVTLDRRVAIKLLPAELTSDAEFVARFEREARTLARLHHPGIVLVHDFGQTTEGHLYFVMEFVDGTDLHKIIHGPGLDCGQALEIIAQICDALQYAHSQGVVHRDIKPANVILSLDGRAKLADFGLARPLEDGSGTFTRSNVVMGTPDYMAPEALAGESDHRADLYSLGVMLYEMLTGRPPRGAWAPPSQRVQVDVRLDEVVIRALQEDRELRYQQASEIKTDVEVIRSTPVGKVKGKATPAPAAKPDPSGKKRSLAGIAAAGVLVAVALGLLFLRTLKDGESKPGEHDRAPASGVALVASLPEHHPEPHVFAAKKQGGKLRVFGHHSNRPIELGEASAFDDFVEVAIGNEGWAARRANGETHGQVGLHLSEPKKIGPLYTNHLLQESGGGPWMQMADGSFGVLYNGDFVRVFDPDLSDPSAILNAYGGTVVLSTSGHILSWGKGWEVPGRARPPVDFFLGASAWASADTSFVAANRQKGVRSFRADGTLTEFPATFEDVIEMDAGRDHLVMRSGSGAVFVSDGIGKPYEHGAMPLDLGPAVSIRAGTRMSAAQMADGTWRAWGESSDLISQVQKIGHAIDLDLHSDAGNGAYMMWIEPVAGEAPDSGIKPESKLFTATKDAPFVNTLGMKFVPVPGTEILMCVHETRRKDYAAFADEVPGVDATWKNPERDGKPLIQDGDHPAIYVSYDDASEFCAWMSEKEGRVYRLPTEREWRFAAVFDVDDPGSMSDAALGKKLADQFPWGTTNEADASKYGNYEGITDGYGETAPVKKFLPNRLGIFDLGGNAWEWCKDTKGETLLLGSGYRNSGGYRRSDVREVTEAGLRVPPPQDWMHRIPGFRCVVEIEKATAAPAIEWTRVERTTEEWAAIGRPFKDGWVTITHAHAGKPITIFDTRSPERVRTDYAVRARVRLSDRNNSHASFLNMARNVGSIAFHPYNLIAYHANGEKWQRFPEHADSNGEYLIEAIITENIGYARVNQGTVLSFPSDRLVPCSHLTLSGSDCEAKDLEYAILDGIEDPLKALGWEVSVDSVTSGEKTLPSWQTLPLASGESLATPNPDGWFETGSGSLHLSSWTPEGSYVRLGDAAVRMKVRWTEKNIEKSLGMFFRTETSPGVPGGQVQLHLHRDRLEITWKEKGGEAAVIHEMKWERPFQAGDEIHFEVAGIGDDLHARVNGQTTHVTTPGIHPEGWVLIGGWDAQFKDVEYTILDRIADPLQALGWEVPEDPTPGTPPWRRIGILTSHQDALTEPGPDGWIADDGKLVNMTAAEEPRRPFHAGDTAFRFRMLWTEKNIDRSLSVHFRSTTTPTQPDLGLICTLTKEKLVIAERERPLDAPVVTLHEHTFPQPFKAGDEVVFEIAGRGDTFITRVNGHTTKVQSANIRPRGPIIIRGWWAAIKEPEYAILDGIEDPLKALGWEVAPTKPAHEEPWGDFLAELADGPHKNEQLGRFWTQEEGGWRVAKYFTFVIPDEVGHDLAVRATGNGSRLSVLARSGYSGTLYASAKLAKIQRSDEVLQQFRLGPDFDATNNHSVELRVVGNTLSLLVDGVELGSLQDDTHPAGGLFGVTAAEGSLVEKVEYRFLDTPLPATASPSRSGDALVDEIVAWVFRNQGHVVISQEDRRVNAKSLEQILPGRFDLTEVHLPGEQVTDAEFARLGSVPTLRRIELKDVSHITSLKPIAGLTELNALWLPDNQGLVEEELVHLAGMTNLGSLRIKLPGATGEGFRHLQRLPKLTLLSLHDAEFTEKGAEAIAGLAELDWLLLIGCVREENQKSLVPIGRMPKLTSLDINGTLTAAGFSALAPLQLNKLNLSSSKFDNAGFPLLTGSRDTLTELDMAWGATVSDEGIRHIVANFPNIERTSASYGSTCTGASIRELAKLPKLKSLSWWVKGMQTADYVLLADLPVIERIGLSFGTAITDEALPAFAKCEHLKELGLSETAITDAGLKALQDIHPLKTVDLQKTKITSAGLAEFQKARPDVEVIHDFGTTPANLSTIDPGTDASSTVPPTQR